MEIALLLGSQDILILWENVHFWLIYSNFNQENSFEWFCCWHAKSHYSGNYLPFLIVELLVNVDKVT